MHIVVLRKLESVHDFSNIWIKAFFLVFAEIIITNKPESPFSNNYCFQIKDYWA